MFTKKNVEIYGKPEAKAELTGSSPKKIDMMELANKSTSPAVIYVPSTQAIRDQGKVVLQNMMTNYLRKSANGGLSEWEEMSFLKLFRTLNDSQDVERKTHTGDTLSNLTDEELDELINQVAEKKKQISDKRSRKEVEEVEEDDDE